MEYPAIEHRSSRPGRWLRAQRVRVALAIALAEAVLVLVGFIPAWLALLVGAAIVAFYFLVGRNLRQDTIRQASWTAALSQILVALVPVLVFFIGVLAVFGLVALAVLALVVLFADRR
jgi:hypothetical protein